MISPNLIICAADEVDRFGRDSITHIISIRNPGSPTARPAWFKGEFLELFFGDVISEKDAQSCKSLAATSEHIRDAVNFASAAFSSSSSKTLIFCDYGASRSPALAYVILAAYADPGKESECFDKIIAIRSEAVPNALVVRLGDIFLSRKGALLNPFQAYVKNLFQGLI